jgi:hypothetical protein
MERGQGWGSKYGTTQLTLIIKVASAKAEENKIYIEY